jgi:acetyl-CoA acetyltransferase
VTAGNASSINDGAALRVLTTADLARQNGLKPLAPIVAQNIEGGSTQKCKQELGHAPVTPEIIFNK